MLLIVIALGKQPDLVSTVIEPRTLGWRKIFAFVFRIDEQVGMAGERHLYESSTVLWNHDQLHPAIRNLLSVPSFVIDGIHLTCGTRSLRRLCVHLDRGRKKNGRE